MENFICQKKADRVEKSKGDPVSFLKVQKLLLLLLNISSDKNIRYNNIMRVAITSEEGPKRQFDANLVGPWQRALFSNMKHFLQVRLKFSPIMKL